MGPLARLSGPIGLPVRPKKTSGAASKRPQRWVPAQPLVRGSEGKATLELSFKGRLDHSGELTSGRGWLLGKVLVHL
ncbi:hypothetical protein GCM10010342_22290 [Streptomyces anulatus]|nr:hypothetical protein GCM10010342_22290 [Streptomyces anulatus]